MPSTLLSRWDLSCPSAASAASLAGPTPGVWGGPAMLPCPRHNQDRAHQAIFSQMLSWPHGCATPAVPRAPCSGGPILGLMHCYHCLEILNRLIFNLCFVSKVMCAHVQRGDAISSCPVRRHCSPSPVSTMFRWMDQDERELRVEPLSTSSLLRTKSFIWSLKKLQFERHGFG